MSTVSPSSFRDPPFPPSRGAQPEGGDEPASILHEIVEGPSESFPAPEASATALSGESSSKPLTPLAPPTPFTAPARQGARARFEAYISVLSTKNNFWHRVCSLIWLPFAFRSGIKMKQLDDKTFNAVLPFRRFNRNWYNAMAGAALLGNAEIAGGMYVFGVCGGNYTVVCKHLEYKFLRPCFGPAVYRLSPKEDLQAHLAHGGEFNITIDMDVCQAVNKLGDKEKRVGRCAATFHVTPKAHHSNKAARKAE